MKIFTSFIFLVLISFCVFQGVSCGLLNYDLTRPVHSVLKFMGSKMNAVASYFAEVAFVGYSKTLGYSATVLQEAKTKLTKLRQAFDEFELISDEELFSRIELVSELLRYNRMPRAMANAFELRMKSLVKELRHESDSRSRAIKITEAFNDIENSFIDVALDTDSNLPLTERITFEAAFRIAGIFAKSRDIIMWIDSNRVLFCISFVAALSIAFYISVKLSLAYFRVLIWLCIKMPYYVLKSIFKYLFGYSNDDEEFDLAENLEESCAVEAEDSTSDSKDGKTTYSQDEFLSSGLPRRALYGDDASYTPSLQDGKLNLKDYDLHVEIADSDMESDNEEASTKGAPEDSSAVSVTFYSLSVAFAVVAFLF